MAGFDPSTIGIDHRGTPILSSSRAIALAGSYSGSNKKNGPTNPHCNEKCTNTTDCTGTNNRGCTNQNLCSTPINNSTR